MHKFISNKVIRRGPYVYNILKTYLLQSIYCMLEQNVIYISYLIHRTSPLISSHGFKCSLCNIFKRYIFKALVIISTYALFINILTWTHI